MNIIEHTDEGAFWAEWFSQPEYCDGQSLGLWYGWTFNA